MASLDGVVCPQLLLPVQIQLSTSVVNSCHVLVLEAACVTLVHGEQGSCCRAFYRCGNLASVVNYRGGGKDSVLASIKRFGAVPDEVGSDVTLFRSS